MILVSACLAGFPCRYDGETKSNDEVCALVCQGLALPVCPEVLGGLPTPRLPSERTPDGVKVLQCDGTDVTAAFRRGADETLSLCRQYGVTRALLKSRSPSCGLGSIYDGTFSGKLRPGNGLTAELLESNGIRVEARG